jgi:ribosomal protein S18
VGRPLKIKKSTTKDIGFNAWNALTNPVFPATFNAAQYEGVVGGVGNGGGVATAAYPVVKCRVFITGQSEEDGFIIRQKGSTKYLVEGASSGEQGVCVLANEAAAALTEGNMNISYSADDSTEVLIAKLTNKFALDYSDVRYAVNFFTDEGTVIKSGTTGQANTATQQNLLNLVIVENYTS